MAKTPEGAVKERVKKLLSEYQPMRVRMYVPSGYGQQDLDFTCCYHGRFFVIETKAGLEEPTERQNHDMRKVVEAGGKAFVVKGGDPSSFRRLTEWLNNVRSANS